MESYVKKDGTNDYIIENDKIGSYNSLDGNIIYKDKYSLNNIYNPDISITNDKHIYYESEIDDKTSKNEDNLQGKYQNLDKNEED